MTEHYPSRQMHGDKTPEPPVTDKEYEDLLERTKRAIGAPFCVVFYHHCRSLGGDAAAALILSYIINRARTVAWSKKVKVREWLRRNHLFFRCPIKSVQEDLGMSYHKVKAALDKLRTQTRRDAEKDATTKRGEKRATGRLGLIEVVYKKRNIAWVRLIPERLKELDDGKIKKVQKLKNPETEKATISDREKSTISPPQIVKKRRSLIMEEAPLGKKPDGEELSDADASDRVQDGFIQINGKSPHRYGDWDRDTAEHLLRKVAANIGYKHPKSLGKSATAIYMLRTKDLVNIEGIGRKERIEQAIDYLFNPENNNGYLPQIQCGESLRAKWGKLMDHMKSNLRKKETKPEKSEWQKKKEEEDRMQP